MNKTYAQRNAAFADKLEQRRAKLHRHSVRCPHCNHEQEPMLSGDTWIWEQYDEEPDKVLGYICESYECMSADVRAMDLAA